MFFSELPDVNTAASTLLTVILVLIYAASFVLLCVARYVYKKDDFRKVKLKKRWTDGIDLVASGVWKSDDETFVFDSNGSKKIKRKKNNFAKSSWPDNRNVKRNQEIPFLDCFWIRETNHVFWKNVEKTEFPIFKNNF